MVTTPISHPSELRHEEVQRRFSGELALGQSSPFTSYWEHVAVGVVLWTLGQKTPTGSEQDEKVLEIVYTIM